MEQEIAELASPVAPATTDACGCTPRSASAAAQNTSADEPSEQSALMETAAAPEAPRRSLKLVVTLTPTEDGQYRATLALGADTCDPVLRSTVVAELSDALSQVSDLHRDAEASWQAHPRNPTAALAPRPQSEADRHRPAKSTIRPADKMTPTPAPDVTADITPPASQWAEDAVAPKPSGGDQLTLFG